MAMAMQGHVGWGGAGRGEARGKRGARVEGANGTPMIGPFCAVDTREKEIHVKCMCSFLKIVIVRIRGMCM